MRSSVKQELEKEGYTHDFENDEGFKKQVKQFVAEAVSRIQQEMEASSADTKEEQDLRSSDDGEEEEEEDEEPSASSSSSGSEGTSKDEDRSSKKKRKKSDGDKKSKSKKPKKDNTREEAPVDDPDFKLLKELANAMAVAPGVYRGFGDMSHEEKVKTLRKRLKEKGAKFDMVPTAADIRVAKAKKDKEKDLEGIDVSNVIEDGRRRRGGDARPSAPKPQARSGNESSSEEEEMEF